MTKTEVIEVLLEKKLLLKVGRGYYFSESISLYATGVVVEQYGENDGLKYYPSSIKNVKPKVRVDALLTECKVPYTYEKEGRRYLLRSEDKDTTTRIEEILNDVSYNPELLLQSIAEYYAHFEYPKAFKNYVAQGDLVSIYRYYAGGKSLASGTADPDMTWL